jgi:hypothetical protein
MRSSNGCKMRGTLTGRVHRSLARVYPLQGSDQTGKDPTNRGKLGTKRHIVVDRHGVPLAVTSSGSNVHDSQRLEVTVDAIPPPRLPGKRRG